MERKYKKYLKLILIIKNKNAPQCKIGAHSNSFGIFSYRYYSNQTNCCVKLVHIV